MKPILFCSGNTGSISAQWEHFLNSGKYSSSLSFWKLRLLSVLLLTQRRVNAPIRGNTRFGPILKETKLMVSYLN